MIVLGGSSMHKGANGWTGGRAIGCLPALTGTLGIPGGGSGPRHGSAVPGQGLASIVAEDRRPPGRYVPNQMVRITEALLDGRVRAMLLFGTDMLSSYADARRVAEGLERADLVVSYDLFMNDTARRVADVVLPATAWLEELGCKSTDTHLYLTPKVLEPPASPSPLAFRQGRTLTQFHGFYDHGRALPTLANADPEPYLWIAPADAAARAIADGASIRIHNERGEFHARARVTEKIPTGTVWMRDGWEGLNRLTSGDAAIPDEAVDLFGFSGGQAAFDAMVDVAPA